MDMGSGQVLGMLGSTACIPVSEPDPLLAAAAQQLYIQAINDCLQGETAAADNKLAKLGCNWRLAAAVWRAAAAGTAAQHTWTPAAHQQQQRPEVTQLQEDGQSQEQQQRTQLGSNEPLVLQHDRPLPAELLHCLQSAFNSSSTDFWQQHNYYADDNPFFSYILDVAAVRQSGPSNALEAAVILLQDQLKQLAQSAGAGPHAAGGPSAPSEATTAAEAVAAAAEASYVEWWAHTRTVCSPHQLHFDAAEGAFRRGLGGFKLVHPAASSVLFLTAEGGPTIVLDQDVVGHCQQHQRGDPDGQQQQQAGLQLQLMSDAVPAATQDAEPDWHPSKRSKLDQMTATGPGVTAQPHDGSGHYHDHHHRSQHALGSTQQHHVKPQMQRLALAESCSLLLPRIGQYCIWPGNRLHGVLPGSAIPLEDPPDIEPAKSCAAAAAGQRTTLILAWWAEDPRSLVPSRTAAGAAKDQRPPRQTLGPCMSMPPAQDSNSSSGPSPTWMQALQMSTPVQLQRLAALPTSSIGSYAAGTWHDVPRMTPAWEQVGSNTTAAEMQNGRDVVPNTSTGGAAPAISAITNEAAPVEDLLPTWVLNHPLLATAELPCLKFCLRNELDIRRAYVPELTAWEQHHNKEECVPEIGT